MPRRCRRAADHPLAREAETIDHRFGTDVVGPSRSIALATPRVNSPERYPAAAAASLPSQLGGSILMSTGGSILVSAEVTCCATCWPLGRLPFQVTQVASRNRAGELSALTREVTTSGSSSRSPSPPSRNTCNGKTGRASVSARSRFATIYNSAASSAPPAKRGTTAPGHESGISSGICLGWSLLVPFLWITQAQQAQKNSSTEPPIECDDVVE